MLGLELNATKNCFPMNSSFSGFQLRLVRHIFDRNRVFDDNEGARKGTAD